MPNEKNIDEFWSLENMLPNRPKKEYRRPAPADTSSVTVAIGEAVPETGAKIPPRQNGADSARKPARTVAREYAPETGFFKKVRILPWPTEFGFYTKFRSDALRYFERTHDACEYVYFFSYMPQYDQMTVTQLAYYLYWRSEVRRGNYLRADNSYLFLYIYEIINLPDKIPPSEGAVLISRLWSAYRADFRYLDKYIGEWLCDYCLIHRVVPEMVSIGAFVGEITGKVSLPEFYLQDGSLTWPLVQSLSAYDYRKSKYYADYKEAFDTHIPAAVTRVMNELVMPELAAFGVHPMRVSRDSFSGAVVCRSVKFKIELVCCPVRRSYELKQLVTGMVKLCENHLRAAFAIKSRFSPAGVDEKIKAALSAYFDECYPDRFKSRRKKQENVEEEAYMALYEPENDGPADITRALAIEEAAWETAALLDTDEDAEAPEQAETIPDAVQERAESPIPADAFAVGGDDSPASFAACMTAAQRQAVLAAARGEFATFCRAAGKMPETVRGEINELAMEQIGDMILDDDFSLIEDYAEELLAALGVE